MGGRREANGSVAVIMTVRERFGSTVRALETLFAHTAPGTGVTLVLPPCPRRIRDEVGGVAAHHPLQIIETVELASQNADRNAAVRALPPADWLAFIDNDTYVPDHWLDRLVAVADRFGAAMAGPLYL
ncbi:MAG: glycosyltransferase family 2 protein, partial [Alphaproteobacteria bacterium]